MEPHKKRDITQALDAAIAKVARQELDRLGHELSRSQVAANIAGALDSLLGLSKDTKPTYDAWDALFYALWYQPSQVNLAYTLAQKMPVALSPLKGGGSLEVFDFGCGALAVEMGLRIAQLGAGDSALQVHSTDESDAMKGVGVNILREFESICRDRTVGGQGLGRGNRSGRGRPTKRWLTAFHVAYRENAPRVAMELDRLVGREKPDLVLVTKNSKSSAPLYRVRHLAYRERGKMPPGDGELCNPGEEKLEEVNGLRRELAAWPDLSDKRRLLTSDTRWDEHVRRSEVRRFERGPL